MSKQKVVAQLLERLQPLSGWTAEQLQEIAPAATLVRMDAGQLVCREGDTDRFCVWLIKGKDIPDDLKKNHPQFEHYRTRKMDPRKPGSNDDSLIRELFGGKETEIIGGMLSQALTWHK